MPLSSGEVGADRTRARPSSPTRAPRSARSAGRSTRCSATSSRRSTDAARERAAGAPVPRRRLARAAHAAVHDPGVRRAHPAHATWRPGRRCSSRWPRSRPRPARMSTLVEDMLLLARLDAGRPLDSPTVDLGPLVSRRSTTPASSTPSGAGRSTLPTSRSSVTRRRAAAAPGRHQPADQRPPAHAARAPRSSSPARRPTARVELAVHDDGPGMPETLQRQRFRALHPRRLQSHPRQAGGGGAGLGLSIVHAIVHAHGGTSPVAERARATRRSRCQLPAGA